MHVTEERILEANIRDGGKSVHIALKISPDSRDGIFKLLRNPGIDSASL
jgi:hypothetical protein